MEHNFDMVCPFLHLGVPCCVAYCTCMHFVVVVVVVVVVFCGSDMTFIL